MSKKTNSIIASIIHKIPIIILSLTIAAIAYRVANPTGVSSIQTTKNLPLLGDTERREAPKYIGVVILTTKDGVGFCSGSVIDNNYIVTAAHCLVDRDGRMKKETLNVRTDKGELIQVNAHAAAVNTRVDVALIQGDFSKFDFIPVDYKTAYSFAPIESRGLFGASASYEQSPTLLACGYPEAQDTLTCIPVTGTRYMDFQLVGNGQLFPGMSGGPVFAMTPTGPVLIAVNTAVAFQGGENFVVLSPVLGLRGEFDIYGG